MSSPPLSSEPVHSAGGHPRLETVPQWMLLLGVALAYYAMARLGLLLAFEQTSASPVWLPSGLAFAATLLLGARVWPGILLGAFAANFEFLIHRGQALPILMAVCGLISVGNTAEAPTGRFLLRRIVGTGDPLSHIRHVFVFVGVTCGMCLVSAALGPTSLCVAGVAPWPMYLLMVFTWWCGDVAGIFVLTPIVLTWWYQPRLRRDVPRRLLHVAVLGLMLVVAARIAFGPWAPLSLQNPKAYLIIPVLLWVACHFDRGEAMGAVALIAGLAIWATMRGLGPFAQSSLNASLLSVQGFICVVAITVLALTVALLERQRAEEQRRLLQIRYQDLYDSAPDFMASVDVQTLCILQCNDTMASVLGYTKDELIGRCVFDYYAPESALVARNEVFPAFLAHGGVRDVEMRLRRRDGAHLDVSLNMSAIRDEQGRIVRTRSIWRDITKRKQLEDELRALNETLEQRVVERMSALAQTNDRLKQEIAERQVVEQELWQVKEDVERHKEELEIKVKKLELLNRVMMEREGRIVEIKAQLKAARDELAARGVASQEADHGA